jgi:hypothetical protein
MSRALFRLKDLAVRYLLRHDIHVMKTAFGHPFPDVNGALSRPDFWAREGALPGIDMDLARQLATLDEVVVPFAKECDFPDRPARPYDYYRQGNPSYGLLSATILHGFIRRYAPKTILEVGSGNSTFVAARAALRNAAEGKTTELTAIDPYPEAPVAGGFPGLARLIRAKVETLDLTAFEKLEAGDILFIDSSHVVATGNDVVFLFL